MGFHQPKLGDGLRIKPVTPVDSTPIEPGEREVWKIGRELAGRPPVDGRKSRQGRIPKKPHRN